MSTKLYSGLKFKDSSADLIESSLKISEAINSVFHEESRRLVAGELIRLVDSKGPRDEALPPIFIAEEIWIKRQEKLGRHHTLNDPLRFSIVFGRALSGELLAYTYSGVNSYGDALEELGMFEDYHYQDSSDRPDEISKKDWNQRAKDWDSVMDSNGAFGHLPMWQLGNSNEPFKEVYMGNASFDANDYSSQSKRFRSMLIDDVLAESLMQIAGAKDELFSTVGIVNRVVEKILAKDSNFKTALPKPIPTGISFEWEDVGPRFTVDKKLVEDLLSHVKFQF